MPVYWPSYLGPCCLVSPAPKVKKGLGGRAKEVSSAGISPIAQHGVVLEGALPPPVLLVSHSVIAASVSPVLTCAGFRDIYVLCASEVTSHYFIAHSYSGLCDTNYFWCLVWHSHASLRALIPDTRRV